MHKQLGIGLVVLTLFFSFQQPAWALPTPEEQTVLDMLNAYRAQHGLAAVALSPALSRAANVHSLWMADNACFAHQCGLEPEFGQRLLNAGYRWQNGAAENIAAGRSSAERTFQMWVSSALHNANLLDPRWRAVGLSRVYNPSSRYRWYWTLDFGDVLDPSVSSQAAPVLGDSLERPEAILELERDGVRFGLSGAQKVWVRVFDLAGRSVFDSGQTSTRTLNWNLLSGEGVRVANGVYFYAVSMANGTRSSVKKIVIER